MRTTPTPALDLPPSVRFERGPGGLTMLKVRDKRFGKLDVFMHGAHVARWHPRGADRVLWLSSASAYRSDAAIRGGVPICFPWFGGGPSGDLSPAHGFARVSEWLEVSVVEGEDGVEIDLALGADDGDRGAEAGSAAGPGGEADGAAGPGGVVGDSSSRQLAAMFRIIAGDALTMTLEVRNDGDRPATFEEALHTYLAVSDISEIAVEGLRGERYLDRLGGPELIEQTEDVIRFTRETDRIYQGSGADVIVDDPGLGRRIAVRKSGSASTIVWNPWEGKASGMKDLDGWTGFVCIETANVRGDAITLQPGESHAMTATIELVD